MKFNREEYARQCRRVSNTPLYRASCPIADELNSLRDSAVEMIADDILDNAIGDPDYIAEIVLENDYDAEGLKEMCVALSAMMGDPRNIEKQVEFSSRMQDFIEMKAVSLAESELEE